MRLPTHVHRRGAVYVWRRRIPASDTRSSVRFVQVSLRTRRLSTCRLVAPLLTWKSDAYLREMMNGRLSHTEAQRYLAAIVAAEIVRLEALRYEEPLNQGPEEWLERVADERIKRAAFELVAARGTAAILLPEDAERLSLEGLRPEDLGRISTELETLKGWISAPEARETVAQSAARTIGRGPRNAREQQMMQCLHLSGQAEALAMMDRIKATAPMHGLTVVPAVQSGNAFAIAATASAGGCYRPPTDPAIAPSFRQGSEVVESTGDSRMVAHDDVLDQNSVKDRDRLSTLLEGLLERDYAVGKTAAAEKTIGKNRRQVCAVLIQFIEIVGDKRLQTLTQADCAYYVDALARLPKVYGRNASDRARSVRDLIERGEELPDEEIGLAPPTVNRNIGHINRLLKFGRRGGMRPAEELLLSDLREKDERVARSVRLAFTLDDLSALAAHSVWAGCKSPSRRHEPSREIIRDGLYWGPLIAAYTGARREELMGLRLTDIMDTDEIPHITICPNVNRGLKNAASNRKVPIHRRLIEQGFLEYVREMRLAGQVDLFPELRPTSEAESFGGNLYKKWTEAKTCALGDAGDRKTFHSFRHTVITHLRHQKDVSKLIVTQLVGHTPSGETDRRYAKAAPLRSLAEAIDRIPIWF